MVGSQPDLGKEEKEKEKKRKEKEGKEKEEGEGDGRILGGLSPASWWPEAPAVVAGGGWVGGLVAGHKMEEKKKIKKRREKEKEKKRKRREKEIDGKERDGWERN